jgi:hypothetical protein
MFFRGFIYFKVIVLCFFFDKIILWVSKKIEKPIKPRKYKKKNWKNWTVKKTRLNRLKFWKNRPVWFYKQKTKKMKSNRTQTKKTEPNRFEPVFALKNRTETSRFDPVSVRFQFFFLIGLVTFFLIKTEPKMITPGLYRYMIIFAKFTVFIIYYLLFYCCCILFIFIW